MSLVFLRDGWAITEVRGLDPDAGKNQAFRAVLEPGKRFVCNVLLVAGLLFQRCLPEVDPIHYVSRVTQPTLMLNGEFDFFFPVETAQKPMFERLGTLAEHKRYLVYPGAHTVPRTELAAHMLGWLDKYLGPVTQ